MPPDSATAPIRGDRPRRSPRDRRPVASTRRERFPSDVLQHRSAWFPVARSDDLNVAVGTHPPGVATSSGTERTCVPIRLGGRRAFLRREPDGTCTVVDDPRGPTGGRPTVSRWGMLWIEWPGAGAGAGAQAFPIWPEADELAFDVHVDHLVTWRASALRVVENLLDTLHPAVVHAATFGDPSRCAVEIDEMATTPDGLRTVIRERSNESQSGTVDDRTTVTELVGPFSTRMRALTGPDGTAAPADFSILTVAVPIDDTTTWYVRLQAFDPRLPRDPDALRAFSARVLAEDRRVVERLHQPLYLAPGVEIHLRLDRPTIAYRRRLEEWTR